MTDLNTLSKAELNALLASPLSASALKKTSKEALVAMFDAMPATDALDADIADARSDDPEPPTADNLTDLEKRVLVAHLEAGIDCNGAETLSAMLADNMTWSDVAETSQRTGLTKKQVSGVIASLSGKGLLDADVEKPNGAAGVDQVLTDRGVRIAFDLLGDGVVANPGPALPGDATPKQVKAVRVPAPKKARVLEDRVLVAPATDLKLVRPTGEGSKRHLLAQALLRGATIEHLMEVTGWNRATAQSALRWDVPQMGLGVERKGDKYFLILPVGVKAIPVKAKDQTRADALVAACR